jgi:membrane-anchored mycosin MYCP
VTTVVALVLAASVAFAPTAPGPAGPRSAPIRTAVDCAEPGTDITEVPWAQRMLGFERTRTFALGTDVTVAVLDSGVDARHPRLAGRVAAGFDAVRGEGRADTDCLGTGTQVAGVIAAHEERSSGFAGVAPRARIVPIRVLPEQSNGGVADPAVLARGIRAAVDAGADVIAVSAVSYADTAALRDAVAAAAERRVVVVAAVGDLGDQDGGSPPPYPASYRSVIAVGAIDGNGHRRSDSAAGPYVDLVAPGGAVVTTQRGDGMITVDGTGVACGFVAGAAALVRAWWGGEPAPEDIARQLLGTAIPAPTGPEYGAGIVSPHAAVVDRVAPKRAVQTAPAVEAAAPRSSGWTRSKALAAVGTVVALLIVVAVIIAAVALPRGRRRLWRAGAAPRPEGEREPDEPGPPVTLFPA